MPEPPLAHVLSESALQSIRAPNVKPGTTVHVAAATNFGPPTQDKRCNEDFALAALLRDREDREWGVIAVADGVSTRTFWAARSSRIACLAAIETATDAVAAKAGPADELDVESLRMCLVQKLRAMFEADQALLSQQWADRRLTPSGWAQVVYEKNMERRDFWYNTTLLVAISGPVATVILHCGDGAVVVRKWDDGADQQGVTNHVLRSTESLEIATFVSRDVDTHQFKAVRIRHGAGLRRLQVVLASDGADRTVQQNAKTTADTVLESEFVCGRVPDRLEAERRIAHLLDSRVVEPDNHSIALMAWIRADPDAVEPSAPNSTTSIEHASAGQADTGPSTSEPTQQAGAAMSSRASSLGPSSPKLSFCRACRGGAFRLWLRIRRRAAATGRWERLVEHGPGASPARRPR